VRTRKGTARLTGNVREARPPPDNRVLELNGPPVKVISRDEVRRLFTGEYVPEGW
jgi:hypothetical protein